MAETQGRARIESNAFRVTLTYTDRGTHDALCARLHRAQEEEQCALVAAEGAVWESPERRERERKREARQEAERAMLDCPCSECERLAREEERDS